MRNLILIATIIVATISAKARGGEEPQMKNISCADISINLSMSTITALTLSLDPLQVEFTVTTSDAGFLVLTGEAPGILLQSNPGYKTGWSGSSNTTLTVGNKKIKTECNIH